MVIFFTLIAKEILRNRQSFFFMTISLLIATMFFIAFMSIPQGMGELTQNEIENRQVDLYITSGEVTPLAFQNQMAHAEPIPTGIALDLSKNDHVISTAPVIYTSTTVKGKNITVIGFDSDKFNPYFLQPFRIRKGTLYVPSMKTVVVGERLAEVLRLDVGSFLPVHGEDFQVSGILLGTGGYEDYDAFMALTQASELLKNDGYPELWVQVNQPEQVEGIKRDIEARYPAVVCRTREDYFAPTFSFIRTWKLLAWLLVFFIGILTFLNMTNTLGVMAKGQTREFGILRILGASPFFIFSLIVFYSLILSFAGGFGGLIFGTVAANALSALLASPFHFPFPVGSISFSLVIKALFFIVVTGTASSLYPAWTTLILPPLSAVRGKP